MLVTAIQFILSGLSVGAAYALSGIGIALPVAIGGAIALTIIVGVLIELLAIEPAKGADVTSLIIVTIGASLIVRGLTQVTLGSGIYRLPSFSGDQPISIMGALIVPQTLWVFGGTILALAAVAAFFGRSRMGKAMLATSHNRLAAMLMGIDVRAVMVMSFGMSALLGALGGALLAPITLTSYDSGLLLGMKGFVGAVLGGLGRPGGAVVGGLLVGLAEILSAAYLSSAYKDAVPFIIILLVLFVRPTGLFGARSTERV
jgi:branched-chain amino acid transport system permease protein